MDVTLIDFAQAPMLKLYTAYRTCYSPKTPQEVWEEIETEKISKEDIQKFVLERLKTGHTSPLEQVVFWFGIGGVSRALSHQLVRHRIGISFEQQSQRYVRYKENRLEQVVPPSYQKDPEVFARFQDLVALSSSFYQFALDRNIPGEDARFGLLNSMPTNFQVIVNFAELLHLGDLRLCHRAQWEIRSLLGKMRMALRHAVPELAAVMQPKCGEARMGYCDEDKLSYEACPLSKVRPHKGALLALWKGAKPLTEAQIQGE